MGKTYRGAQRDWHRGNKKFDKKNKKQDKWKDAYSNVDLKQIEDRQPDDWKDW